ncbi:MAG: futalosine hydrolase [Planctomycetota bacterium]|nr:futalosine hydrolase [Planctomycetota bacterium]
MSRRILIITAVEEEANAIGNHSGASVVASGIGKTNAAVATTRTIDTQGPFDIVISAGIAGSLPKSNLSIGDVVVANACVYAEEGVITQGGFQDMKAMGFELGNFEGNAVPVDSVLLERIGKIGRIGSIATVATCSGTNEQAKCIADRTGCICEAMEGAAVVHAARIAGLPAIEIRTISNTTGKRDAQEWDIELALSNLGVAINAAIISIKE